VGACRACGAHITSTPCPYCGASSTTKNQEPVTVPSYVVPPPSHPPTAQPNAPQSGPPADPHPPAQPAGDRAKLVVGAIVIAALSGAAVYAFSGATASPSQPESVPTVALETAGAPETSESASSPTEAAQTSPAPQTPTPTETALTEEEERTLALTTLDEMVLADRALRPVRGQWVAQLASKFEGVVDTSQQSAPFTVPQILDEVELHRGNPEYGHLVRLILQGDWGKSEAGSQPLWVTVVDLDYSNREAVLAWCEDHFTQRGEDLLNVCYPRELHLP